MQTSEAGKVIFVLLLRRKREEKFHL